MSTSNPLYCAGREELLECLKSEKQYHVYSSTRRFKLVQLEEMLDVRLSIWDKKRPKLNNADLDDIIEASMEKIDHRPELVEVLEFD